MTKPNQQQLDQLEERIEQGRRHLDATNVTADDADDEPRFIDEGDLGTDVVDNTIVPPG